MSEAMVVLSGGQDSTTCLFWALRNFDRVNAIGLDYGQRHKKELDCAANTCKTQNVPFEVLDLGVVGQLSSNALTDMSLRVDSCTQKGRLPNTFVPGRNLLFLSFAAIAALKLDIRNIVTGVCETDFSGYPDCRQVFIESLEKTLFLAMDYPFKILTPLMNMKKAQIWALAAELGCLEVIKHNTLTCYNGVTGAGCGDCPACKLRNEGYSEYEKSINRTGK